MFAIGLALMLAADAPAADPREVMIRAIFEQVRAGQNVAALAALDPMAADVDRKRTAANTRYYCASSQLETLAYLLKGATADRPNVVVLPKTDCSILFMRAYALENLHRLPEALTQLRTLIEMAPDNAHFFVEYGAAQRQVGDLTGALATYRHAIELASRDKAFAFDHAAALRGVGYILTEDNDLDGAEEAYRQSLDFAPGHPVALNELNYIARLRAKGPRTKGETLESNIDPAKSKVPVQTSP